MNDERRKNYLLNLNPEKFNETIRQYCLDIKNSIEHLEERKYRGRDLIITILSIFLSCLFSMGVIHLWKIFTLLRGDLFKFNEDSNSDWLEIFINSLNSFVFVFFLFFTIILSLFLLFLLIRIIREIREIRIFISEIIQLESLIEENKILSNQNKKENIVNRIIRMKNIAFNLWEINIYLF